MVLRSFAYLGFFPPWPWFSCRPRWFCQRLRGRIWRTCFLLMENYYVMIEIGAVEPSGFRSHLILILMEWWQEFFLISCGSNFSASGTSNVFTETDQVFMRECLFFRSPLGDTIEYKTQIQNPMFLCYFFGDSQKILTHTNFSAQIFHCSVYFLLIKKEKKSENHKLLIRRVQI